MKKAITFILVFTGFLLLSFNPNKQEKPNVLFFLVDDLGWADMGFNGSTFYETPNLNMLAKESVEFTRGYAACSVCSPSRATIMTGKNSVRLGITDWINHGSNEWKQNTRLLPAPNVLQLPHTETTLAEMMQSAGYTTFFSGKWHLGTEGSYPENHGFQINKGGFEAGNPGSYFAPFKNPRLEKKETDNYLPERLSNETCQFLETHKDKPFLAYHSFYLVHTPLQAKKDLIAKYQRKRDSLGLNDATTSMGYDVFHKEKERVVRTVQSNVIYAAMMEALDNAVGKIVQKLKKEGLYDNTIIIFTSDNGGLSTSEGRPTSNLPLRGGKGWAYEGGIRVPYLIRLPNNPNNGTKSDAVAWGADFYPTIAEAIGAKMPKNQALDGQSLIPILKGGNQKSRTIFWHYPHYGNQGGGPATTMMEGDWKLIHWYDDDRWELFNIKNDISEKTDLYNQEKERVAKMRKKLKQWLSQNNVKYPTPNPNFKAS
jgi:arylsulfatase A-like enzyme